MTGLRTLYLMPGTSYKWNTTQILCFRKYQSIFPSLHTMSAHDDDKTAETAQFLEVKEGDNSQLPSPVSAQTPKSKPKLPMAVIIPVWMAISISVIIYNNYLYNTLEFRFPVFLVTWHLTFAVSSPIFNF